jgi:hypothetical protein
MDADDDETVMCEVTYTRLVVTIEDDKLSTSATTHTTVMRTVEWDSARQYDGRRRQHLSLALRAFENRTIHVQDGHLVINEGDELKEDRDHEFKLYRIAKLDLVVYKRARIVDTEDVTLAL